MTETRQAGLWAAATTATAVGFTGADALLFHGWTRLFILAVILAVAVPIDVWSARWWLRAVDAAQPGRHRKPQPARVALRVRNSGGHAYTFTERHGEHVWDETHSDTGFMPGFHHDDDDTDVLPAVDDREEAYR